MHHQQPPATPRKSPKPPRSEQPKKPASPGVDSPAAKRLARRRSYKPPEPAGDPPPAPQMADESPELASTEDSFDDKEVDSVEEDRPVEQIRDEEMPPPPEEELPESDPPPEVDPPTEESPPGGKIRPPIVLESIAAAGAEEVDRESMQKTEQKMQRIVDLVMWRDVSRTALVFGIGTFFFLSSSYAGDVDFSLVSGVSYLGLFYLAGIFLLNSILRRGVEDCGGCSERCWVVGEEEALVVIRMVLPYVNEILTKLRALFSGDPSTTMKMAMLLFVLARCGGSITFWTLGKLAFFGMFTIPRICASYSSHISRYGAFWLERFKDAWDSCTHKKAAAAATFTIVWNLSSTPARVWSVFMLAVVLRYYQQSALEGWGYLYDSEYEGEHKHELANNHLQQQEQIGADGCKIHVCLIEERLREGQAATTVATTIVGRPKGANVAKHRLRSGVASKLEMGTKEKKVE